MPLFFAPVPQLPSASATFESLSSLASLLSSALRPQFHHAATHPQTRQNYWHQPKQKLKPKALLIPPIATRNANLQRPRAPSRLPPPHARHTSYIIGIFASTTQICCCRQLGLTHHCLPLPFAAVAMSRSMREWRSAATIRQQRRTGFGA